jgi:SAM-dependent methyltransferase
MAAKPQRAASVKAESGAPPIGAPGSSLRARLAAWWEGTPSPRAAPGTEAGDSRAGARKPSAPGKSAARPGGLWPRERIDAATLLWGAEFVTPAGAEAIVALAAPLDLQPGEALLDAAAALGGAARALAAAHQVRVTAMEPSSELAAAGMALSKELGAEKAAPVAAYDPRSGEFKRAVFNAALAHELVFTLDDKEKVLRRIVRALKPGGRLLIGDYVIPGKVPGPTIAAWQAADPSPVRPWTLDDARKCLAKLHIDVTAATDETARLRALIVVGLDAFAKGAGARAVTPAQAKPLAREISIWALRKEALDAGELRFISLHGVKTGEPA